MDMGTRFIKLLKILIKIAIMGLVMAGIIVINRKYMMGESECAGICSLPLDISIYTLIVIIITATVQSVFGVGVLLFGTPLLLLQYEKLTLVLPIVLPISIAINIFQVLKHYKYIDTGFYKRILFITIPFVIVFLALVLFLEAKFKNVGIGIFVGLFMLFVALKSYSLKIEQILKAFVKYEKNIFHRHGDHSLADEFRWFTANSNRTREKLPEGHRQGHCRGFLWNICALSDAHSFVSCHRNYQYPRLYR